MSDTAMLLQRCCKLMLDTGGNISVKQVLEKPGSSPRLLQKRFKDAVGLSLEEYLNIIRLRESVNRIGYPETPIPSMTKLALPYDNYDQAHFTNAFRQVTRTTPGKFKPTEYLQSLKK
ncbi:helix-turn-helix domain-containing protein [uncultured Pontibacter sp.]|uniref:helix-turn-helix domain-containing protein n=1 Tax=uncultured Pontibacter sp. TaxID=453356 RepID=UPI00261D414E|nr:helix-turn-helix domain-containing protein [uncultured Pontibacter sp.]